MTKQLTNLSYIKELSSKYGFTFEKKFGQNFIVNPSVCPRICEHAEVDENTGGIDIGGMVEYFVLGSADCGKSGCDEYAAHSGIGRRTDFLPDSGCNLSVSVQKDHSGKMAGKHQQCVFPGVDVVYAGNYV